MPTRFRQRPGVRGRSVRAGTSWGRIVQTAQFTIATSTKVIPVTFLLDNQGISETVRRTRGMVFVTSDQPSASEAIFGAYGLIVVTDAAAAIGVTAVPGPVTEANDDGWFVWQPFMTKGADTIASYQPAFEFDSKAMRKVDTGFQIVMVIENASGTNALVAAVAVSMLTSRSFS